MDSSKVNSEGKLRLCSGSIKLRLWTHVTPVSPPFPGPPFFPIFYTTATQSLSLLNSPDSRKQADLQPSLPPLAPAGACYQSPSLTHSAAAAAEVPLNSEQSCFVLACSA